MLAELTRITMGAQYTAFGGFETGQFAEPFGYYAGWTDKIMG
jgi:hypothetical protein